MPNTPRSLLRRDSGDAQTVADAQPASRGTDDVEQDYTGGLLSRLRDDNGLPPIPMRVDYDPASTHPPAPRQNQMHSDYQQKIDAMGRRLDEITGLLGSSHTDSGTRRLQNEFNAIRTRMADIQAMNTEAKEPDPYMNVGNGVVFDRIRREYIPNPYLQQKQGKLDTTTTPTGQVLELTRDENGAPVARPVMRPSNLLPGEDEARQPSMPLVEDVKGGFTEAMGKAAEAEAKLRADKDLVSYKAAVDANKPDTVPSVDAQGNPVYVRIRGDKATPITTDDNKPVAAPKKAGTGAGGDTPNNQRNNLTKQVTELTKLLAKAQATKRPPRTADAQAHDALIKGLQEQLGTAQKALNSLGSGGGGNAGVQPTGGSSGPSPDVVQRAVANMKTSGEAYLLWPRANPTHRISPDGSITPLGGR